MTVVVVGDVGGDGGGTGGAEEEEEEVAGGEGDGTDEEECPAGTEQLEGKISPQVGVPTAVHPVADDGTRGLWGAGDGCWSVSLL